MKLAVDRSSSTFRFSPSGFAPEGLFCRFDFLVAGWPTGIYNKTRLRALRFGAVNQNPMRKRRGADCVQSAAREALISK